MVLCFFVCSALRTSLIRVLEVQPGSVVQMQIKQEKRVFHIIDDDSRSYQHTKQFRNCFENVLPLPKPSKELDDGWPESVEEQGLLLLVWRHHITKQYIKDV